MFGGGDDDLFDFVPDIDGDGDHDLLDFLIMDDILQEEERETEGDGDFDPDEDEEDFDEDDENDENDEFDDDKSDEEDFDDEESDEDSLEVLSADSPSISAETDVVKSDQSVQDSLNKKYIEQRRANALANLNEQKRGTFYGSREELLRSNFVAFNKCEAAKYLIVSGGYFLYTAAVSDHFELPFVVPAQFDTEKMTFETLLVDLVEDDPDYAMGIWDWCLDTFQPYLDFAEYKNDLTHAILLDISNFPDDFVDTIVTYMEEHPEFIDKLILNCTDSLFSVEDLVVTAIQKGNISVSKKVFECALNNKNVDVHNKTSIISSIIEACSVWDELETMEAFEKELFPLVCSQSEVRIKNKIPAWKKQMTEHITEVEETVEAYQYSRKNAWRQKYKELAEASAAPDPVDFDSEEDYIDELNDYKYSWRKYCSNRFSVDPQRFETREEYNIAVHKAAEKENESRTEQMLSNPANTRKYSFCKVSIEYPQKPYLYYLTGGLFLSVGNHVIVPLGDNNDEVEGVVMAVGECMGVSFPCPVSRIKKF